MNHHIHAKAATAAHVLHRYVQRMEAVSHTAYLGMVSFGSHDYRFAAAAMLVTVVVGGVLHVVVSLSSE